MPTTSPNPSNARATKSRTTTSANPRFRASNPLTPFAGLGGCFISSDRLTGEVLEHAHQPRMVPALAAECGGGVEQLLGRRRVGQRETEGTSALQGEVEILLVQFDAEAGVEGAFDHALAMH